MTAAHQDQNLEVAQVLASLTGNLRLMRDAGMCGAKTLTEQRAYRAGFNAALRLLASSALLLSLDDPELMRE